MRISIIGLVCSVVALAACEKTDYDTACTVDPSQCDDYDAGDDSSAGGDATDATSDTRDSAPGDAPDTFDSGRSDVSDADTAETCTPITCPAAACGTISNGCSGTIDCPACSSDKTCDATSHTCVCKPIAACPTGLECGNVPDGCGGTFACPTCTGGKTCNTTTNKCETTCTPAATCPSGKCGTIDNGCGTGTITCSTTCTSPATCGGGGTANICGCTKTGSCGSRVCGTVADGCGGTITCGTLGGACPSATPTCNASGACVCSPTWSCTGKCGPITDSCGGTQDCGGCTGAQTCGGGGTASVCGCTSIATAGKCAGRCNTVTDECGTHDCGAGCSTGLTCSSTVCSCTAASCPVYCGSATSCVVVSSLASSPTRQGFAAVMSDGSVRTWGSDAKGELGDGGTSDQTKPIAVSGLASNVKQVGSGAHGCAVMGDGSLRCWGVNSVGQFCDGTTSTSVQTPKTIAAFGFNAKQVVTSAGSMTCVLLNSGAVQCCGANGSGMLGNGDTTGTAQSSPQIAIAGGAQQIAAGLLHVCALMSDGSVQCWGGNTNGQIGAGSGSQFSPITVIPASPLKALSVVTGGLYTCARMSDGTVKCWGADNLSQLGDGGTTDVPSPKTIVALGSDAIQLAAGFGHLCKLTASGSVSCWGYNLDGEVGNGSAGGTVTAPTFVMAGVKQVVASQSSTCANLNDGTVKCWGSNGHGELGNPGAGSAASSPVKVTW